MTQGTFSARGPLTLSIDGVIAQHGAARVLFAALRALIRPPPAPRPLRPDALSDHVRRDIGLAPSPPPLPSWSFRP